MSILNIMWAGGSAFASVQKVHQQILAQADSDVPVHTWLLQGSAAGSDGLVEQAVEWNLSSARLKGRHLWKWLMPWMRARFQKALPEDVQVVLLDGIGVARVLLPVLKHLPQVRAVVIFHGVTRLRKADRKLFEQLPASQLTLAAVSQTLAGSLERYLQRPVAVLRSAFDPAVFRAAALAREPARSRLGLPLDGSPAVGAVGRLVDGKGFGCLLEAFASATADRPDARLVIIGEGPARPRLEARIEALGLRDKVYLPGHIPEAATLYRAFDWVAIPSTEEGLGLILQEAVMAGVPVLTSELAVFREQLGDAGWYAPVDSATSWGQLLARAFVSSGVQVVEAQSRALAPEQAWNDFTETTRRLFSCR
ncbi:MULTISPECIES: glycosyltransferase [Pseudomonas]|jgi:glycosyltransferase involved in cell wall biosynthesis|uniref:Glycosyltransferase involved in cell wall biosynthesis n=1 Tax=Pseudomonas poae TaxID=200451 RepID=A0A7Z1K255_9PSED|nr:MULTISPECIES: glycosyltransferase [Pseudomonas]HAA40259.1 glycosyl transferase [Pseudomonas sp.]KAA8553083.1 2-deoxystreptamine glucosyltransferase [Pseudomonas marginalis]NMZ93488.1 glycosyltransferase [Pseudomonas marginalis]PFG60015.1 glycosyltransferase involved in cell wall biosynthesis [Pseudomonas poae]TWR71376.1 glycosyltransferase [Pseudomonas marginalis]